MIEGAMVVGGLESAGCVLAALCGLALVVSGVRIWVAARSETRDLFRALLIARGFRRAIIGLCVAVFAIAWWADIGWLMGLAVIIVGEETLESSVHVAALRDGIARAARRASGVDATAAAASRATSRVARSAGSALVSSSRA